ncbi:peptide chain release factor 2 [bacterium endosymbiont of Pedicinus badii]|nr:peptide chain release factor 2 [bacterium endosymbiont of Pedicinus badii]
MEVFLKFHENTEKKNYFQKIYTSNNQNFRKKFLLLKKELLDLEEILKMAILEKENTLFLDIFLELKILEKKLKKLELSQMFRKKYDTMNCYLDIQSGSGGLEAQDWSSILLRMYLQWCSLHNYTKKIIYISKGESSGIKSATIKIKGKYSYGWLRTETGIHRLVRKSPFNTNHKRHTSFSSIFVYPEIQCENKIKINNSDLKIDFYRSSGAGGQHVNRTESAVRIRHIPTNIVTQCQNSRSQHSNRKSAMKQLVAKIHSFYRKKKKMKKKAIDNSKSEIAWGNQIRSYILDDSRIKDLRTKLEIREVNKVLSGKIDQFIRESLKMGL